MADGFYFPWKEVALKESSFRHPNTCRKGIEMIYNKIGIYRQTISSFLIQILTYSDTGFKVKREKEKVKRKKRKAE
jgi:hypothetical protein